jgi:hypothetical protein
MPQFNYYKPGLAVDPFYEDETTVKKTQLMQAILQAKRPDADELIARWLDQSDFQTSFRLITQLHAALKHDQIERAFGIETGNERFERFLQLVEARHGRTAEIIRPVLNYLEMQQQLVDKRKFVTEPVHRFFFALLLNLDDREHILEIVRQRYPDEDAVEKVLDWLFDLSQTRVIGQDTNVLGLDLGPAELFALEGAVRGKKDDEIVAEFAGESPEADPAVIHAALEKIRSAITLRPLLA